MSTSRASAHFVSQTCRAASAPDLARAAWKFWWGMYGSTGSIGLPFRPQAAKLSIGPRQPCPRRYIYVRSAVLIARQARQIARVHLRPKGQDGRHLGGSDQLLHRQTSGTASNQESNRRVRMAALSQKSPTAQLRKVKTNQTKVKTSHANETEALAA